MITKFNDPQVNSLYNSTGNNNLLHSFLIGFERVKLIIFMKRTRNSLCASNKDDQLNNKIH